MKTLIGLKRVNYCAIVLLLTFAILTGCSSVKPAVEVDGGSKKTETEYGWGITGLVGTDLNIEKTSVYGLASYHRYSFETGNDNLLRLGVQGRRMLGADESFWLGGELAYVHDTSVYDDAEWENPSASGFTLGAIAGYKLPVDFDMSVFGGVAYINFGDFKANGQVVEGGHSSTQLRLGVEIGLSFLQK